MTRTSLGSVLLGCVLGVVLIGALPAMTSADPVPSVTFLAPQSGAVFTGANVISLQVSATDSSGIRVVEILNGERLLCTDTSAPYACTFTPSANEIGSVTFVADAINSAGAQALAVRTVQVGPTRPLGLSLQNHVTTVRAGSKVATSGTLRLPPIATPSFCNQGAVQIEYSYGHSRSFYLAYVNAQCHFSTPATLIRGGGKSMKAVAIQARFLGSRSLIGTALLRQLVSLRLRRHTTRGSAGKRSSHGHTLSAQSLEGSPFEHPTWASASV
jgi:Bacterial Ig domain